MEERGRNGYTRAGSREGCSTWQKGLVGGLWTGLGDLYRVRGVRLARRKRARGRARERENLTTLN